MCSAAIENALCSEWVGLLTDAERDGQLATTGDRVDSEGSVTGGDGYQVGKDADGFGLVTLSRRGVVRTSHDDCELDLEAKFEEHQRISGK